MKQRQEVNSSCPLFRTDHLKQLMIELMGYDQTRLWATDAIVCELILCVYVCVVYA